jgi:uncharacterized membrane protein
LIKDTLEDASRLPSVYGPVGVASVAGAAAALAVGWFRPAPWLLAVLLIAILGALWLFTVARFVTSDVAEAAEAVGSGVD